MELSPENSENLYGRPEQDIKIDVDKEAEAKRQAQLEELRRYNCVWIDGEWVSLGC